MRRAWEASTWSKDPSTQVGAVICDARHRPVSSGCNGLPQGMSGDEEVLQNRELKYACILHAEENAILFAHRDLSGCVIYTYPVPPCASCASKIRQSGITRVVAPSTCDEALMGRWAKSLGAATLVFGDAVTLDLVDLEELVDPDLVLPWWLSATMKPE